MLLTAVHTVQPVSRRACNMSYVLLSLSMNWMMLVLFVLGSLLSNTAAPLALLAVCSQQMLPLFLLANVLTGAVNVSWNLLSIPVKQALCVVCVYMGLICCAASLLGASKLRFKHCKSGVSASQCKTL